MVILALLGVLVPVALTSGTAVTRTAAARTDGPTGDADEVLNTGGVHRFACSGIEHSTPWVAVAPANVVRSP